MKIAMILRRLNVKGGTQRQALSLARELKRKGHTVILYTFQLDRERCYPELLKEFTICTLPKENGAFFHPGFWGALRTIKEENRSSLSLAKIMDKDFDVINPHDQVSYKVAYFYKKHVKDIPSVWNMNDLPLRIWGYDRMKGCEADFYQPWHKLLAYRLLDAYDKHAFIKYMDAIVVVDFFNRDLVKKYLKLKAFTVRSGPDFDHFTFKEKDPPNGRLKLLSSGILMPHRRYEDSIRAIPLLVDAGFDPHLTIIGDIDNDKKYFSRLSALVSELNLQNRVTFAGKVSEEDLINAYHDNHIYIFQHHLQSDGLSPFEAASTGCPLLISKTAGCHEVMTDGKDAFLIQPKNPEDIAEKVSLLASNKDLFSTMAKNANDFVRNNFSWPKYADGVLEIFNKVKTEGRQINL